MIAVLVSCWLHMLKYHQKWADCILGLLKRTGHRWEMRCGILSRHGHCIMTLWILMVLYVYCAAGLTVRLAGRRLSALVCLSYAEIEREAEREKRATVLPNFVYIPIFASYAKLRLASCPGFGLLTGSQ